MERSEALEIVREYYPSSGKDLNEALETLVPELKESEDERIRKAIFQALSKVIGLLLMMVGLVELLNVLKILPMSLWNLAAYQRE